MSDLEIMHKSADPNAVCDIIEKIDAHLTTTDIEVDTNDSIRIPFDVLPSLGVGMSSLSAMFQSVSMNADMPTLLQVTDKAGNPLDPSILQKFNDGTGLMGSFRNPATGFEQARFHEVDAAVNRGVATMPYDPTMLFMAAALAQVNQKLDGIQNTVNEIFEYMRQKDKAELRGNVRTLEDVLLGYRNNWNNDIWCKNSHMKVMDIKQDSEQAIIHLRAQIRNKLNDKGFIEIRLAVAGRIDEVLDRLKEYQLATYTYSFASFLEPMLCGNFDKNNLQSIANKISDHSNEYRELYTECHNIIEESSKASVDSVVLDGASAVFSGLGSFLKNTPLGDLTPIDSALEDAGRGVNEFNEGQTRELMEKLHHAQSPDVAPFRESIEAINDLYNVPHTIAIDRENVYLLSA